jgi:hypothetical protein
MGTRGRGGRGLRWDGKMEEQEGGRVGLESALFKTHVWLNSQEEAAPLCTEPVYDPCGFALVVHALPSHLLLRCTLSTLLAMRILPPVGR